MKDPLDKAQGRVSSRWAERTLVCLILGFLTAVALAPTSLASNENDLIIAPDATEDNLNKDEHVWVGDPTLTQVTVWYGEDVTVHVFYNPEAQKPAGAEDPPLSVQSYFTLEATGSIESAKIQFRVPTRWAEQNLVDKNSVRLLRLNGEWQELPTELIQATDYSLYYEATSPGFSVFAVAGQSAGQSAAAPAPLALYAVLSIVAVGGGFSAFYWFRIRPMKPFVSLPRLKRRVMGGKPRRAKVREPEMAATLRRLKHATKLKPTKEPSIEALGRPGEPKVLKGTKKDVKLLKRLKRKMDAEK